MSWNDQDQGDVQVFSEPIAAKKDVSVEIVAAISGTWKVKEEVAAIDPTLAGKETKTVKVTVQITDESVVTEHADARPRLTFEQSFNIEGHPYVNKRDGKVSLMSRNMLFSLEEALGFEPVFVNGGGQTVEPFITRTGRKVAPKVEGVRRKLNPDFAQAYFQEDGSPTLNWAGIKVYADIELQSDEKFGDRNAVSRFKKAPVSV